MSELRLFDDCEPAPTCRYPNLNGTSSYRYGCRCDRCTRAHRDAKHPDLTCKHPACEKPRAKHRSWCAAHIPPPKPSKVRSHATCEVCRGPNQWYESQLAAVRLDLRDLYRRTCAACRSGYMSRIKAHHLPTANAVRLISLRECELCHNRFPVDNHGTPKSNVDHDHSCCPGPYSCGRCVRGIVCARCNLIAGALEQAQRTIGLDKLVAYIDQHRTLP